MLHLFITFFLIALAFGHGALDEQIAKVSSQISENPIDPQLYLNRADLHKSHRNLPAAHKDLTYATKLRPPFPPAFLRLAQFERKQNRLEEAQTALNKYFSLLPPSKLSPIAHREKALLSPPADSLSPPADSLSSWHMFLEGNKSATMHDFALATQTALKTPDLKATRKLLSSGLLQHPKSIQLHQLQARLALTQKDHQAAAKTFQALQKLYPNLLVKLHYEESLIWQKHHYATRSRQALLAALNAFNKLPPRLQKNDDLQSLVIKIKDRLLK